MAKCWAVPQAMCSSDCYLFGSKASIDFWEGRQEKGRQIHGFAEPR